MLLVEELHRFEPKVDEAIGQLRQACIDHQPHPADLLLAALYAKIGKYTDAPQIGLVMEAHAAHAQGRFISEFRRSPAFVHSESKFQELLSSDHGDLYEETTVHMELMIYLKFWESDIYQIFLTQLSSLAMGKPFNWRLQIKENTTNNWESIASKLRLSAPKFRRLVLSTFSNEVRNCVAHSQYFFDNKSIVLLGSDGEQIGFPISFRKWRRLITRTLLLQNRLDLLRDRIFEDYAGAGMHQVALEGEPARYTTICVLEAPNRWAWSTNLGLG